jgi:RNase H-like domain found in reverse transcriptase
LWGEAEQASFNKLKVLITSSPVFVFLDDSYPYRVGANSSTTGAVISQQSVEDERKWHPIALFSKSLILIKWNYKIHDKDMLAL